MIKGLLLLVLSLITSTLVTAQNVNIPDPNFKAYLVGNSAINTNADGEIQLNEATAFTDTIDCSGLNISDLTGIEAFTALRVLYCQSNTINSFDISQNGALTDLNCSSNLMSGLDVSGNTALEVLDCSATMLSTIDVTQNVALTHFYCTGNPIFGLDLSQNSALTVLECYSGFLSTLDVSLNPVLTELNIDYNTISSMDFSQNPMLTTLNCRSNNFTTINVSQNPMLTTLICRSNDLITLDVSQNPALIELNCKTNDLTSLDISQNPVLTKLDCSQNELTSLNLANSNNTNITFLNASGNQDLTCIDVDDITYSLANWSAIDGSAYFSTNCALPVVVSSISVQGQGGNSSISTNNGTLQMQAIVIPNYAADPSFTWSVTNGTGSASIDTNGLLTALTDGSVTVIATANDGSGVTGSAVILISNQIPVGVNTVHNADLSIYPNPVSDVVNVLGAKKITSIKLLDLAGRTIKSFNSNSTQLNVSEMASGVYLLEITNAEEKSIIKLFKI